MFNEIDDLIKDFSSGKLDIDFQNGKFGIEREALRVDNYNISQTQHPIALGSALTNKFITTDFSEALLELITPPQLTVENNLSFLEDIHHFVTLNIENEILWPFSVPPIVNSEDEIPIAVYGSSNSARFKRAYRRGLAQRYGKTMQTLAGVHFNYSFSDRLFNSPLFNSDKTENKNIIYFRALRNLHRLNWLILYFFGASPVINKNFKVKNKYKVNKIDDCTYYLPDATTLRMSDLGYSNIIKSDLDISLDNLKEYLNDLALATTTPCDLFKNISTNYKEENSQINSNILQNEDEYYATSRPKSSHTFHQRTIENLRHSGVDYLELRSLDINPFERIGIDKDTVDFLEIFIIYCALKSSPYIENKERQEIKRNDLLVCTQGRKTSSKLFNNGSKISIKNWALEIIDEMIPIADHLDCNQTNYHEILIRKKDQVLHPDSTFSNLILEEIVGKENSFLDLGRVIGEQNKSFYLHENILKNKHWDLIANESRSSSIIRQDLEANENKTYKQFIREYYSLR